MTVSEAREWLRIDNEANDQIIEDLIAGAEEYITLTTGLLRSKQEESQLAQTAIKFLLSLWYDPTQVDADKLKRTIDSLLKTLTTLNTNN
nr:MAG TPA: head tail connector [Caudoviricetes sp.]